MALCDGVLDCFPNGSEFEGFANNRMHIQFVRLALNEFCLVSGYKYYVEARNDRRYGLREIHAIDDVTKLPVGNQYVRSKRVERSEGLLDSARGHHRVTAPIETRR